MTEEQVAWLLSIGIDVGKRPAPAGKNPKPAGFGGKPDANFWLPDMGVAGAGGRANPVGDSGGGTPTLRKGDKGKAVRDCQALLNKHGASLTADGDFGDRTLAAVKDFQKKNPPLKSDGIVGPQTWAALSASKPGPKPAPAPAIPTGALSMKVVWEGTGEPVRNAMATVDPPPLPPSATMEVAGNDGRVNFEKLAVGQCTITVEMLESKATQQVTISEDTIELAEIELPRPATGKLTVKVVWAGSNRAVANAAVSIDPPPMPPAALFELADNNGIANFDDVIVGKCAVTARAQGSTGRVNVDISEDSIELATIALPVPRPRPAPVPATGRLLVKVTTKGQPVAGQKITVISEDRRPEPFRQESATKNDGVALLIVPAGIYNVISKIAPFAISANIEAGKTTEVDFAGNAPPDVVVDLVPWTTYFNEQLPICENEWFILNIGRTVPIFPGPGGTATNFILECMVRNVTVRVAADDKLAGRSPQAGRTRGEIRGWYQQNKKKLDGLDEPL